MVWMATPTNTGGKATCPITSIHPSLVKTFASISRTLYVFPGETGTVFVIDLCHSIFGPIPAPGYHPEGMYEFKQTTRPMSCSLWRPTLPLVSVSAKNP
jgi:hypothetical protein